MYKTAKYIKRGVKRKHDIIQGVSPLLEHIAKIEGIKKIVPTKISYSPIRRISQPKINSRGAIQEIFVAVDGSKKKEVGVKIKEELEGIYSNIL